MKRADGLPGAPEMLVELFGSLNSAGEERLGYAPSDLVSDSRSLSMLVPRLYHRLGTNLAKRPHDFLRT